MLKLLKYVRDSRYYLLPHDCLNLMCILKIQHEIIYLSSSREKLSHLTILFSMRILHPANFVGGRKGRSCGRKLAASILLFHRRRFWRGE